MVDPEAGLTAILLMQRLMRSADDTRVATEAQTLASQAVGA